MITRLHRFISAKLKAGGRLDDNNRSKKFWSKAIMFLADNKTFSLDMISGLETFAIGKAIDFKHYKAENTVNPKYEIDELIFL